MGLPRCRSVSSRRRNAAAHRRGGAARTISLCARAAQAGALGVVDEVVAGTARDRAREVAVHIRRELTVGLRLWSSGRCASAPCRVPATPAWRSRTRGRVRRRSPGTARRGSPPLRESVSRRGPVVERARPLYDAHMTRPPGRRSRDLRATRPSAERREGRMLHGDGRAAETRARPWSACRTPRGVRSAPTAGRRPPHARAGDRGGHRLDARGRLRHQGCSGWPRWPGSARCCRRPRRRPAARSCGSTRSGRAFFNEEQLQLTAKEFRPPAGAGAGAEGSSSSREQLMREIWETRVSAHQDP